MEQPKNTPNDNAGSPKTLEEAHREIDGLVKGNKVVLFMKGNRLFPRCGFSATVVEVLKRSEVTDCVYVDVLQDPAVRSGIKTYAEWPTIPQLYVRGEFIGGCDIVRDMYENGELEPVLWPDGRPQAEDAPQS